MKIKEIRTEILPEDLLFIIRQLVDDLGYNFQVTSKGDVEKMENVVTKYLIKVRPE